MLSSGRSHLKCSRCRDEEDQRLSMSTGEATKDDGLPAASWSKVAYEVAGAVKAPILQVLITAAAPFLLGSRLSGTRPTIRYMPMIRRGGVPLP